jgi:predicted dehydrogenase
VLLEKPLTSNSEEAKSLFAFYASLPEPRPILCEAFHSFFHPAWHCFMAHISPKDVEHVDVRFGMFDRFFSRNNIRFKYELAGGALMDIGTYSIAAMRRVFGEEPVEILSAEPKLLAEGEDQRCDEGFKATYRFPNGGIGAIDASLRTKWYGLPMPFQPRLVVRQRETRVDEGAGVVGETRWVKRTATNWWWTGPHYYHWMEIIDEHTIRNEEGKVVKTWVEKEVKKAYTWNWLGNEGEGRNGEVYWSSYRYMLEEFVNRIRDRAGSGVWVSGEESIKQMTVIDQTYEKGGLPVRPSSMYKP